MIRAAVYFAVSVALLSLFSCEVCPYIEGLGRATMGVLFGAFFGVALLLRAPVEKAWVLSAPVLDQPRRQFILDFGAFVAVGVALTVFDRLVYGFPVTSGMKALLGAGTVGIFFGADSALSRERTIVTGLSQRRESVEQLGRTFSLSRKFIFIALATLGLMAADIAFMALRDLKQLSEAGGAFNRAQRELVIESGLSLLFFFPLTVNLLLSFARNLKLFLDNQHRALELVAAGQFDVKVPVASADEFGEIALHTNRMIDGLRDRERVRDLFGKLLSPAIAKRLLSTEKLNLGGSRRKVVVLFSDVRNFTARTERAEPEALVADLNRYFEKMVEIVHANGGIVDKFIGDGMMAIFGLENFEDGANAAVKAAARMLDSVEELNRAMRWPLSVGIGIHAGEAIAGIMGSPERHEFTFIGDSVNVAARIEGLTKALKSPLLISAAVKDALKDDVARWPLNDKGPQALKGRTSQVRVFSVAEFERKDSGGEEADDSLPGVG